MAFHISLRRKAPSQTVVAESAKPINIAIFTAVFLHSLANTTKARPALHRSAPSGSTRFGRTSEQRNPETRCPSISSRATILALWQGMYPKL